MNKLSRWPRVYQGQLVEPDTDADFVLDDFDETIAADIESTRRGMRALNPGGMQSAEFMALQNKLVDGLIEEMKEQRHQISKIVQSLNAKASKGKLDEFAKSMREATDKRLDSIRNWALLAVGAISTGVAVINMLKK